MDEELKPLRSFPGPRATSLRVIKAWIQRFEAEQRQRRQYCKLAWAVNEMARRLTPTGETMLDLDPQRLKRAQREIQQAIGENEFGDQLLNICENVRPRRLKAAEARAIGSMTPVNFNGWPEGPNGMPGSRPIVEDLWTTRERLEAFFVKKGWRVPDWLALPPQGGNDILQAPSAISRSAFRKLVKPIPNKGARRAARMALDALYPHGVPEDKTGQELTNLVNNWLKKQPSDLIEGRVKQTISLDTVLRAAERK
jgi:hypothetical protein